MKTNAYRIGATCALSVLTAIAAMRAPAGQTATAAKATKTYTGTVVSVDPQDHQIQVKGWFLTKEFNLGENCRFALLDPGADSVRGLRPGQRVTVSYQDARGVLVADRIEQQPLRYEGVVKAIDPAKHQLTVHHRAMNKTFALAGDCKVMLRGGRTGSLADVQPGNHVTVIYEIPEDTPTARRIDQTSATFTGQVTAIDLTDRTIKAKHTFGAKKFNLADDCAIVLNGRTDGQMRDLKPGDELVFSYDEVNGVNVVNRIARAEGPVEAPPPALSSIKP
jgi:Cu/Ag efflux protein CusF